MVFFLGLDREGSVIHVMSAVPAVGGLGFDKTQRRVDFRRADILIFIQHVPQGIEDFFSLFDSNFITAQAQFIAPVGNMNAQFFLDIRNMSVMLAKKEGYQVVVFKL